MECGGINYFKVMATRNFNNFSTLVFEVKFHLH